MKSEDLLPCVRILLMAVFAWNMNMAQDAAISCHVTPANVTQGEGANLTCTFPVDIKEYSKDFYVQRSNDTAFGINENVIVRCFWLNPPGPSPNCSMEKGYAKLIVEGSTVTIGIPDATTDQTGYYKCSMVNPGPDIERHPCVFSVAESSSSGSSATSTGAIIGIAVGGVVGLVAVAVSVYCWRKKNCWKSNHPNVQRGPPEPTREEAVMLPEGNVRERIEQYEEKERDAKGGSQPLHT